MVVLLAFQLPLLNLPNWYCPFLHQPMLHVKADPLAPFLLLVREVYRHIHTMSIVGHMVPHPHLQVCLQELIQLVLKMPMAVLLQ